MCGFYSSCRVGLLGLTIAGSTSFGSGHHGGKRPAPRRLPGALVGVGRGIGDERKNSGAYGEAESLALGSGNPAGGSVFAWDSAGGSVFAWDSAGESVFAWDPASGSVFTWDPAGGSVFAWDSAGENEFA
ncbi:hypothetical protein AAL_02559 [Moelleriella libera RCEF 2490]|uniref:Uncharacterized protein n=1 Tax=Moelleriella libera RCEF 2490 TaxID=1081109 RepID=A0A168EP89_9HYPO|nr:hypothetical protein AAL_02559 [Moelleriella libera RCEF 2490]